MRSDALARRAGRRARRDQPAGAHRCRRRPATPAGSRAAPGGSFRCVRRGATAAPPVRAARGRGRGRAGSRPERPGTGRHARRRARQGAGAGEDPAGAAADRGSATVPRRARHARAGRCAGLPDGQVSAVSIPWNSVSDAVERVFGLHLREGRLPDLKRALKGAAAELGHADSSACAQLLLSGKLDAASSEVLASHLTIGETYFFRDSDAFAALSTRILPELIAARRRAGELRLRIWSAACCTGEETYSIAILLNQLLPDIADWQVTLLGTDVNPRFLRKAFEGVYGQWSFRNVPEDVRARYF